MVVDGATDTFHRRVAKNMSRNVTFIITGAKICLSAPVIVMKTVPHR